MVFACKSGVITKFPSYPKFHLEALIYAENKASVIFRKTDQLESPDRALLTSIGPALLPRALRLYRSPHLGGSLHATPTATEHLNSMGRHSLRLEFAFARTRSQGVPLFIEENNRSQHVRVHLIMCNTVYNFFNGGCVGVCIKGLCENCVCGLTARRRDIYSRLGLGSFN